MLVAFAASGCAKDAADVSWVFVFPDADLSARATRIDAELRVGGCDVAAAPIWTAQIHGTDGDTTPIPELAPGTYAFLGRARDDVCTYFAAGCTELVLPKDEARRVEVMLESIEDERECADLACIDGECRPQVAVAVAAGRAHSCAALGGGEVWCWGRNEEGQLGNGTTSVTETAVRVRGLEAASVVAAGGNAVGWQSHTCAIEGAGRLFCWGYNQFGQLGDGTVTTSNVPVEVMGLPSVVDMSAGNLHTCAATSNGNVACWGDNGRGQLGDGTTEGRITPIAVPGAQTGRVVQVAIGHEHTCARDWGGHVRCWGANDRGQLGDGTLVDSSVPALVEGTGVVMDIAAGEDHTCAVRERDEPGTVVCWGSNRQQQLGDGTGTDRLTPTLVPGLTGVVQIGAGSAHTCARLGSGELRCWGTNSHGELGGGPGGASGVPVAVLDIDDALDLSVSHSHACAARRNGSVFCWGRNQYGRLGDGTIEDQDHPVMVIGLGD